MAIVKEPSPKRSYLGTHLETLKVLPIVISSPSEKKKEEPIVEEPRMEVKSPSGCEKARNSLVGEIVLPAMKISGDSTNNR